MNVNFFCMALQTVTRVGFVSSRYNLMERNFWIVYTEVEKFSLFCQNKEKENK